MVKGEEVFVGYTKGRRAMSDDEGCSVVRQKIALLETGAVGGRNSLTGLSESRGMSRMLVSLGRSLPKKKSNRSTNARCA